jgi:ankyrin repeat protein
LCLLRIDVDVKDGYERTALHWACAGDHGDIVSLLLHSSALDSCIDASGMTALHYCVQNKSVSSAEAFVGVRDMTHLPNNEGRTPLMEAAASNVPEIVRVLLRHSAVVKGIDKKDPQGMTSKY